jgi:alkylation response protein AidB-like acyl-CoA dehydrogenase
LVDAKPSFCTPAGDPPLHERALLLLGAFAVGIAEATRDMAVEYAKTREQFGRPIGSFQAIKHICADMAIRCEAAACQTTFASLVLAEGHDGAAFHATSSKLVAAAAAVKNASQNIQVHGAIGFTAEADPHLFLKRAHVIERLWSDSRRCRDRLLSLDLPE